METFLLKWSPYLRIVICALCPGGIAWILAFFWALNAKDKRHLANLHPAHRVRPGQVLEARRCDCCDRMTNALAVKIMTGEWSTGRSISHPGTRMDYPYDEVLVSFTPKMPDFIVVCDTCVITELKRLSRLNLLCDMLGFPFLVMFALLLFPLWIIALVVKTLTQQPEPPQEFERTHEGMRYELAVDIAGKLYGTQYITERRYNRSTPAHASFPTYVPLTLWVTLSINEAGGMDTFWPGSYCH